MVCFVVFRTDSMKKALTAIGDLGRYGKIKVYDPRIVPKTLVKNVMLELCGKIKNPKEINVIAKVNERGGRVIFSLRKIHPPAHLVVVTPRHEIFDKLVEEFSTYMSLARVTPPKRALGVSGHR